MIIEPNVNIPPHQVYVFPVSLYLAGHAYVTINVSKLRHIKYIQAMHMHCIWKNLLQFSEKF